jgi:hypothetical protein
MDLKLLRQNDFDLKVQYHELLCLRAELAKLLSRSNSSPREYSIRRAKRNQGRAPLPPFQLPTPGHLQTQAAFAKVMSPFARFATTWPRRDKES